MDNETMAVKLAEADGRARSNTRRIEKLEQQTDALSKLASAIEVMAEQIKQMRGSIDSLDEKVETLESKPGKRWDGIVDKAIWAVAGGIIAFLLAQLGI